MEAFNKQSQRDRSDSRSRSSARSLIDADDRPMSPIQPLRPTFYQPTQSHRGVGQSEHSDLYGAGNLPPQHPQRMPSNSDLESGVSYNSRPQTRSHSHSKSRHATSRTARPRKKTTRTQLLKSHISLKLRLTISFGITLLVASIIYLALSVTHVSNSTTFHALSIIMLLILTAIFSHSLIRWLMLKRDYRAHTEKRLQRTQPPSFRGWDISWPMPLDNQPPPEPIPVYMSGDHAPVSRSELSEPHTSEDAPADPVMAHPPPIYGNFRDSVRINPTHISLHPLPPPSIHTPTYAESISRPNPSPLHTRMHGGLTYRPPSYGSEGGITQVLENRRREVEGKLKGVTASDIKGKGKVKVGRKVDGRVVGGAWVREKKGGRGRGR